MRRTRNTIAIRWLSIHASGFCRLWSRPITRCPSWPHEGRTNMFIRVFQSPKQCPDHDQEFEYIYSAATQPPLTHSIPSTCMPSTHQAWRHAWLLCTLNSPLHIRFLLRSAPSAWPLGCRWGRTKTAPRHKSGVVTFIKCLLSVY